MLAYSDQWFAEAANLINPARPITIPGKVVYTGGWYDGWETRRHNPNTFDYVVIRLGAASGTISGVEVDTAFFNGNEAPGISVEGCISDNDDEIASWGAGQGSWETILGYQPCGPSRRQGWRLNSPTTKAYTHVRLNMYPDGGIARFRLYGRVVPVFPADESIELDLAAAVNGGLAVAWSDQHFGSVDRLLVPGRGKDMSDGWETRRSRVQGHVDWVIVKLGIRGKVNKVVVDTAHFRGNFPESIIVRGIDWNENGEPSYDEAKWVDLVSRTKCGPDKEHEFQSPVHTPFTHVLLVMIPDGGIKRFRVFGTRST